MPHHLLLSLGPPPHPPLYVGVGSNVDMAVFFPVCDPVSAFRNDPSLIRGLSQVPPALTGRPWKWRTALARRSVSLPARWHIQTDRSLRTNDSSLLLEMIEAHHRDLYQSRNVCVCVCVCLLAGIEVLDERWWHRGMRTASSFLTWKWRESPSHLTSPYTQKHPSPFLAIWLLGNANLVTL